MRKGIPAPNWTATPNLVFELMPLLTEPELRVLLAITRATIGWHQDREKISLTQLQELTGLSRQGVITGIERAMGRELVRRYADGQSYYYELSIYTDNPSGSTNEDYRHQSTNLTSASQPGRPVLVNDVDQSLVNVVDQSPIKETIERKSKETDRSIGGSAVFKKLRSVGFSEPQARNILKKTPDLLGVTVEQVGTWIASKPEGIGNPAAYAYKCMVDGRLPFMPDDQADEDEPAPTPAPPPVVELASAASPELEPEPEDEEGYVGYAEAARIMLANNPLKRMPGAERPRVLEHPYYRPDRK